MIKKAHISGTVEYRGGDGPNIAIRRGPCEIAETAQDATISWNDGDSRGSAAIPISDYRRHVASGAIQFNDTATTTATSAD